MIQSIWQFLIFISMWAASSKIISGNWTHRHLGTLQNIWLKNVRGLSQATSLNFQFNIFSPAHHRKQFLFSHICHIRSFWPAYEVPREGLSYVNPFSLPCFVLHTFARADIRRYHQMLVYWSIHFEQLQGAVVQSYITELQFLWHFNVTFVFPYDRE